MNTTSYEHYCSTIDSTLNEAECASFFEVSKWHDSNAEPLDIRYIATAGLAVIAPLKLLLIGPISIGLLAIGSSIDKSWMSLPATATGAEWSTPLPTMVHLSDPKGSLSETALDLTSDPASYTTAVGIPLAILRPTKSTVPKAPSEQANVNLANKEPQQSATRGIEAEPAAPTAPTVTVN